MILRELAEVTTEFTAWNFTEQVKFFVWFLHTHEQREFVQVADVRRCFADLGVHPPSNCSRMLDALTERSPKQMLRSSKGYQLEFRVRGAFDERYGLRDQTIRVHQILTDLVPKVADPASRSYLQEAIVCLRHKAFRAATVMAWNVAFDHLCRWLLSDQQRLAAFNVQLVTQFQKKGAKAVVGRSDFSELKESDVIVICRISGLFDKNTAQILTEKLEKRNQAAHPSGLVIDQLIAESVISDLFNNVVLVLR